ncbi:histidine kinase [Aliihoeflea aestuarii]|jgi:two-component sensor histidine kinase|uniref:sensor histidine kinase n=1 Tax=Aliihoeflea aestuarii TaxID=453840 RepID=UPI0020920423|nr:HWE histidine kinase domain-containing protein [Aliihoeflea aestuarii]MCO6391491.1 histidine kinase [Aliihoeflea aestuarii]
MPVATLLAALVAVALIPTLLFIAVLLERNNRTQQDILTTLAEATAGSISETVDRELVSMVTTLRVLSTARSLLLDNQREFYDRAAVALEQTNSHLILFDEDLNQLFNTRVPFGSVLGRPSDPGPIELALQSGNTVVSNAFYGQTAQKWVFNVIVPWTDGVIDRALVLTQNAEDLTSVIAGQNLRGGWNASVVDGNGVVVATTFMSSEIGKPFFLWPNGRPDGPPSRTTISVQGEDYETIAINSSLSGWQVVVWSPSRIVAAPQIRALQVFALGGILLAILSALAAWVLGRQLSRPVRELEADARRLGSGEAVVEKPYGVAEIATISAALAEASRDRQQAESEIRFLMREVAHRSKNQLTVVSSIAKQTARHAPDLVAFQDSFQKRVQGLARSTDLLIAGGAAGVELRELLEAQIEVFRPDEEARLSLTGQRVRLSHQAAQTIGLAVHELATNAAKYGAFAASNGHLAVTWTIEGDRLAIDWQETVPGFVAQEEGRGFGSEVIERMLGGTLDAEIERTVGPEGLSWRFVMPVEKLQPEPDAVRAERRFG